MLSKRTITKIAMTLATLEIEKQCNLIERLAKEEFEKQLKIIDVKIEQSLEAAFKDERISEKRMIRILNSFCDNLRGTSHENQ